MADMATDTSTAIDTALGGGEPAATPPPASVPPTATTPPPATPPVTPDDPEFDFGDRKLKRSELLKWEEAHKHAEALTPLRELEDFLKHPDNRRISQAVLRLLENDDDAKLQQILDLFEGKAPVAPITPTAPAVSAATPATNLEEIERALVDADPHTKAIFNAVKAMASRLEGIEKFKTAAETSSAQATRERQAHESQARAQKSLEESWKSQKFDDLVGRYPEASRAEIASELKNRILFAYLSGQGKIPMPQIAKSVYGRASLMIDGLLSEYTAKKAAAPPAGGAGATPGGPGPKVPQSREEVGQQIDDYLKQMDEARAG